MFLFDKYQLLYVNKAPALCLVRWPLNWMSRGAMESEEEKKKKINDDVVVFMRKRSETEAPRYTARLKTYVDFQQK